MCFDKAEYQFETACENYCRMFDKTVDSLTDEDYDKIWLYAGNHIGFFISWIIKNNFQGEEHDDNDECLQAVRNETMTGTEFLMQCCDGKFWDVDVSDDILDFVTEYYEKKYLSDYSHWVIDELGDMPLEFIGTWEDYHEFEHVIDNAYGEYKSRRE